MMSDEAQCGGGRNRLAGETSPYLLQHAANPVDWMPWGEEAFAEARRRDVPIFLSVGYATCYWCHVMERESFEDADTAALLNKWFVCVKVDREERPDIDDAYMMATQLMTGRGGWPMSVFVEPVRLRPFWCGTYFPPEPRHGMPSFSQVLERLHVAWTTQREEVEKQAANLTEGVGEVLGARGAPVGIGGGDVERAIAWLLRSVDQNHGGFGGAPKFPQVSSLELLLDAREVVDEAAREMIDRAVRLTLDKMAIGGIFDQVGGGFHRYAVDATWTVPHFEKMLYDNALLAGVYARARGVYGDVWYGRVARATLEYVLREMRSPLGGFYSAQDAEVDGREGLNYVWTMEELREAVGNEDAAFAGAVYGVSRGANFRDPHDPGAAAVNVLRLDDRPERVARGMGMGVAAFVSRLDGVNARLYEARRRRKQPRIDDKVLAAWNGMMIAAMSRVGASLGEARFLEAASTCAEFMLTRMVKDRVLMRSWREGEARVPGFLEDYAAVIEGLCATASAQRATGADDGGKWLDAAEELAHGAMEAFGDGRGGLYDTRANQADLFIRPRSLHDGATPSGGAMMLHALLDLSALGCDWREGAIGLLRSMSHVISASPQSLTSGVRGLLRMLRECSHVPDDLRAEGGGGAEAVEARFTPVEVYADRDRVTVLEDVPAELNLVVRIADGHHIMAAEPGVAGLVPLRVSIAGGGGVAVYADYPAGEPIGPDGALGHHGTITLRVALERTGPRSGRPMLIVTFQACTETECLAPMTLELDVAIDGR